MVRKAETIRSMDELNVSSRSLTCLKKYFSSVGDAIKYGRYLAYYHDNIDSSKWESELVDAIKEAGFVRPWTDFARSFSIGLLYAFVYDDENFIWRINQLSNEQYECFVTVSDEDIESVRLSLRDTLAESERGKEGYYEGIYEFICQHLGLDGNGKRDLSYISKLLLYFEPLRTSREYNAVLRYFGLDRKGMGKFDSRIGSASRTLRQCNTLPAVLNAPSSLNDAVFNLYAEYNAAQIELYCHDPIYERERKLHWKLEHMKALPFKYSGAAAEALNPTPIEELDLSFRAYHCLRNAAIHTVYDILLFPKDSWCKIRNIRRPNLEEVIEKMHSIGYKDFNIDPLVRSTLS